MSRPDLLKLWMQEYHRKIDNLGDRPFWFGRRRWQRRYDKLRAEYKRIANLLAFGDPEPSEILAARGESCRE
jgi:hypothetical protein